MASTQTRITYPYKVWVNGKLDFSAENLEIVFMELSRAARKGEFEEIKSISIEKVS